MFSRFLAVSFIGTGIACIIMFGAALAGAAEMPAPEAPKKCKIVYINGDAVLACFKAPTVKRIY